MPVIDPCIYDSRPASDVGRLDKEIRTYDVLDMLGIPFLRVDHEVMNTIADCEHVDEMLGINICKNLFLCNSQKTEFFLLLLPGNKKFKTGVFSKLIGSPRLSFAPPEYMEELLDLTPGSVTILGLMNDTSHKVHLYMDKDIADSEYMGCHPCINTSSLRIKTSDLLEKFLPYTGHTVGIVELPVED